MLALHFSKILATDDDNKGLNCFHPAFHGKHALATCQPVSDLRHSRLDRGSGGGQASADTRAVRRVGLVEVGQLALYDELRNRAHGRRDIREQPLPLALACIPPGAAMSECLPARVSQLGT